MGLKLETTHEELDFILGARCMERRGTGSSSTTCTSHSWEGEGVNHSRSSGLERVHIGVERCHVES